MTKHFCDGCKEEIQYAIETMHVVIRLSDGGDRRIALKLTGVQGNEFCRYCFIDAVKKLDDREDEKNE